MTDEEAQHFGNLVDRRGWAAAAAAATVRSPTNKTVVSYAQRQV